jgi:hypothetical protein
MRNLNLVLELANGVVTINTFFLLCYLVMYFGIQFRRSREINPAHLIVDPDVRRHAVALAVALMVDKTGAFITRATVWYWRRIGVGGAGGPMNYDQTLLMLIGAILMSVGVLMLTHVLARPRYGNIALVMISIVDVVYVVGAVSFW